MGGVLNIGLQNIKAIELRRHTRGNGRLGRVRVGRQEARGACRIANNMGRQSMGLDDLATLSQGHHMAGDLAHLRQAHTAIDQQLVVNRHEPLTDDL